MKTRFHPSMRKLQRWLDHGAEPDPTVDAHVSTCERCANRLEELAQPHPELASVLTDTLRAPDDLVQRLGARMNDSLRTREDLRLFFELVGVPMATIRNLMEDDSR